MIREFTYCEQKDFSIKNLFDHIQKMREVLEKLSEGSIPNTSEYTREDLLHYATSLVTGQRESLGRIRPGSWGVAPDDTGMGSDARVDFVFIPTYVAVATLSRILQDHPTIFVQVPGFLGALKRGLRFAGYRRLTGHGYESLDGMAEAVRILSMGKVPELLFLAPSLSLSMHNIFVQTEHELSKHLSEGRSIGPWRKDYTVEITEILGHLHMFKGRDLIHPEPPKVINRPEGKVTTQTEAFQSSAEGDVKTGARPLALGQTGIVPFSRKREGQ